MLPKVVPLSKYDKNGLDQQSVLFANYFFLNNHEISIIRNIYNKIDKNSTGRESFKNKMLEVMHNEKLPLFDHLFSFYEDKQVDWNNFFQFVVFFSLAPQVSIFYFLFFTFPTFESQVSTADLARLLTALRTVHIVLPYTLSIFYKYDLNNDGCLNWNQFFAFASQTPELWETLYVSRIHMLHTFFPNEGHKIILRRRKNINFIKQYQEYHKGTFPHESCLEYIKRLMKFKPNPNRYDYSCDVEQLSFIQLLVVVVKKYNPNFRFGKHKFAMKFLGAFNSYPVIFDIDKFYIIFRNFIPKRASLSYAKDSLLSETSSVNSEVMNRMTNNGTPSKKSILRTSTRVSHSRKSINNLSMYGISGNNRKSTCAIPNILVNTVTSPTTTNKSETTISVDMTKYDEVS